MKTIDQMVFEIFDSKFEKMRQEIFEQSVILWLDHNRGELDDYKFNEYVCYYTDLISSQLRRGGISPIKLDYTPPDEGEVISWR